MNFTFSEEHEMLREMARKFADEELRPRAAQVDEDGEVSKDVLNKIAELGMLGVPFPEEYDGGGMGELGYCVLIFLTTGAWPVAFVLRRRRGITSTTPWVRRPHVAAGVVVALEVAFLVGLALALPSALEITYGVPWQLVALLCLPMVAGVLTVGVVGFAWRAWRHSLWSLASRLHYSAVAVGAVLFTAWLHYWNLLGFRF